MADTPPKLISLCVHWVSKFRTLCTQLYGEAAWEHLGVERGAEKRARRKKIKEALQRKPSIDTRRLSPK